jgi:hypothetical protein
MKNAPDRFFIAALFKSLAASRGASREAFRLLKRTAFFGTVFSFYYHSPSPKTLDAQAVEVTCGVG